LQEKQDYETEKKLIENWQDRIKGIKNYLIRKRWHKCEVCWITEWNWLPAPIELHHINWNSEDNREQNIKLICPNCHSQTDNYKSKNKNSTRKR
jgi:Zn finger protein HypA/HybF involved in hydrogenase expression